MTDLDGPPFKRAPFSGLADEVLRVQMRLIHAEAQGGVLRGVLGQHAPF